MCQGEPDIEEGCGLLDKKVYWRSWKIIAANFLVEYWIEYVASRYAILSSVKYEVELFIDFNLVVIVTEEGL